MPTPSHSGEVSLARPAKSKSKYHPSSPSRMESPSASTREYPPDNVTEKRGSCGGSGSGGGPAGTGRRTMIGSAGGGASCASAPAADINHASAAARAGTTRDAFGPAPY